MECFIKLPILLVIHQGSSSKLIKQSEQHGGLKFGENLVSCYVSTILLYICSRVTSMVITMVGSLSWSLSGSLVGSGVCLLLQNLLLDRPVHAVYMVSPDLSQSCNISTHPCRRHTYYSGPLIAPWIPKNGIPDVCLTLGSMFLGTWRYSGTTNLVLWKSLLE